MTQLADEQKPLTEDEAVEVELPASPISLMRLSMLIADENSHVGEIANLINSDMLLAAAVLKSVNSARFSLISPVRTVGQAVTFLGARQLGALTFEIALRSAFGDVQALEPIWQRAAVRGKRMSKLAGVLGYSQWPAHSAGLFEECGKAALYRHRPQHYPALLRAAPNDEDLLVLERSAFGVTHDQLGARLCAKWGLDNSVVASVRLHLAALSNPDLLNLPASDSAQRHPLALSILVRCIEAGRDLVHEAIAMVSGPTGTAVETLERAVETSKRTFFQTAR